MPPSEYPKIETYFNRGDDHKVTNEVRCPEFKQISHWLVTEKIDGTNIRVSLELDERVTPSLDDTFGWRVRFYGRTSAAQIPTFLLTHLQDTFSLDAMMRLWRGRNSCKVCAGTGRCPCEAGPPCGSADGKHRCGCVEPYPIVLFGEGYGERIQKGGGNYREGVSFRLFDVLVASRWWLDWANVESIARRLMLETVPELGERYTAEEVADIVQAGIWSRVAYEDCSRSDVFAEGVVARTDPYLYDKHGKPLRFKLKTGDFA
jgi:hypothetical protein